MCTSPISLYILYCIHFIFPMLNVGEWILIDDILDVRIYVASRGTWGRLLVKQHPMNALIGTEKPLSKDGYRILQTDLTQDSWWKYLTSISASFPPITARLLTAINYQIAPPQHEPASVAPRQLLEVMGHEVVKGLEPTHVRHALVCPLSQNTQESQMTLPATIPGQRTKVAETHIVRYLQICHWISAGSLDLVQVPWVEDDGGTPPTPYSIHVSFRYTHQHLAQALLEVCVP
jgi:hypothetical protein